jgi:uroporphyrinogen-III synthase
MAQNIALSKTMNRAIYLLSPTPHEGVENLPIIEFKSTTDTINLKDRDTLIFTSKQAVTTAFSINPHIIDYPTLSIGKATTQTLLDLGFEVIHSAKEFYGEVLINDIVERFFDKKLLYLRPQEVSSDIAKILREMRIDIEEQIIYQTRCKAYLPSQKPPKGSIIIITSPSTLKCFIQNFGWDSSYVVVAIGEVSSHYLPQNSIYHLASQPLIEACIAKALDIQKS